MKKKKILLSALVATAAVATLASCGTKTTTTTGSTNESTSTGNATETTSGSNTNTGKDTTTSNPVTDTTSSTETDTTSGTVIDTTTSDTTTGGTTAGDDTTTGGEDTTTTADDPITVDDPTVIHNIVLHYDPSNNYENDNFETVEAEETVDILGDKVVDFDIADYSTLEDDYRTFAGWYYDTDCTLPFDATAEIADDELNLYAKWTGSNTNVTYGVSADSELSVGKLSAEFVGRNVTITSGTEIRSRNKKYTAPDGSTKTFGNGIKLGGTGDIIKIVVPSDTTMSIYYDDGSGSTDAYMTIFKDADCTQVYKDEVGADGDKASSAGLLTTVAIEEGTYYIMRGAGTIDVFDISFTCSVPLSQTEDIKVVGLGDNFVIEGNEYSYNDITVQLLYQNGSSKVLETGYTVDTSAVDITTPGTYEVKVSYEITEKLYNRDVTTTHEDTYEVVVYQLDSITLGTYATYTSKNAIGTTEYKNGSAQLIYTTNSKINTNYITVIANVTNITTGEETTLILPDGFTTDAETSFDSANAGVKTVTYTYESNNKVKTAAYVSTVTTETPQVDTETNTILIDVDASYSGLDAAVTQVGSTNRNTFSTINAAMDFLRLYINASNSTYAGMNIDFKIEAGYYNEKVEFDLPNMTVTGAGRDYKDPTAAGTTFDETKAHYDFTNTTKTVIEYDSLFGVEDASGYVQTTDSTATVAVRYSAENFKITGVTISNYINTVGKTYTNGEHRALALLVQADKFIMDDCCLYGYQDTIELFKGRQVIENTLITGATDFIFGSNNTTYFYKCEIRSVDSEDSKGAATVSGGYITAFKGCASGADDAVEYGAIFDDCDFTCDGNVLKTGDTYTKNNETVTATSGNTAIARPWGAYAKVAVINSTLGAHISTVSGATYDSSTSTWGKSISQNARYVSMSGNEPTATTTKFVEYNNDGDGAITDATVAATIAGLTFISDATEGAKYSDFATIFAATNGKVEYSDNWQGDRVADVTINYYDGETLLSTVKDYSGGKAVAPTDPKKDGYEFVGWYTDDKFTTEYKFTETLTTGTLNLYAKFESQGDQTTYTYTYGTDYSASTEWTETFNGTVTAADTTTKAGKLAPGTNNDDYNLTLNLSSSSKKIQLTLTGFTTGSSNASKYVQIDFYNGTTKVSTTVGTTPAGKANGSITLDNNGLFTLDTAVDKIVIYSNTSGRSIGITSAEVVAYAEVDQNLINKAATLQFGTANADLELKTIQNTTDTLTIGNYVLNVDATTGKLNTNNGNTSWSQFNSTTAISFKVKAGASITVTCYSGTTFTYKVGDADAVAATTTATFSATTDSTIVITSTSDGYIGSIAVAYTA